MTKVKLCGLKRPCDIEWANAFHPDYVGFVFAGTKRRVTDETAQQLRMRLSADIPAVGVFVNEPIAHIAALVQGGTIQLVQLHGQEDEAYIRHLRQYAEVPIIQAFSVTGLHDIARAENSPADYILLDHGAGGTGQAFAWSMLNHVKRPYFLAGGLTPENAVQALAFHPYALDISSGIETNGVKDKEKIKTFMMRVRNTALQEEIK